MQKLTFTFWFTKDTEEAVDFYIATFKDGKKGRITHYDAASAAVSGQPEGAILTIEFELFGTQYVALNGGPAFTFNESASFVVDCKDQAEVDYYWNAFIQNGGQESQCGWLKDKWGFSWQIVPTRLNELLADPDPERASRAMKAMLSMKKLDIATLEAAADGK